MADEVSGDSPSVTAPVALREDLPLTGGGSVGACGACGGGARAIAAGFALLSAAVTLALLAQIYAGDYQVVPHGSASTSAAECSHAGTDALKAGGGSVDAAAAAALCLAVVSPATTSLDANGAMLYWQYRTAHAQPPNAAEWSGEAGGEASGEGNAPPRLLIALAQLHARWGTLPWREVLQPAVDLAKTGSSSSEKLPKLALFLENFQQNTSSELALAWGHAVPVHVSPARGVSVRAGAGGWRLWTAGEGGQYAADQLTGQPELPGPGAGPASALAVVDPQGTYVALATGLPGTRDLAPAIMTDESVCGTRYVLGAASGAALAAVGAALAGGAAGGAAVEGARGGGGGVNLVQQAGDALLSHADSRSGGLASRF